LKGLIGGRRGGEALKGSKERNAKDGEQRGAAKEEKLDNLGSRFLIHVCGKRTVFRRDKTVEEVQREVKTERGGGPRGLGLWKKKWKRMSFLENKGT